MTSTGCRAEGCTALADGRQSRRGGRHRLTAWGFRRSRFQPAPLVIGLGSFAAHGLALAAISLVSAAQVAAVAALRETGILFVIALTWRTARRPTRTAALGAGVIFAGVVILAVT